MTTRRYWLVAFFAVFSLFILSGCASDVTADGTSTPTTITVTERRLGSDITSNSNTIYLYYRPLTSTNEVIVKKNNNRVTWEVDYIIPTVEVSTVTVIPTCDLAYVDDPTDISDGLLTGTIKYIGALAGTDSIEVTYVSKVWSVGRCQESGSSSALKYFITGATNIVPGSEIVSMWRKDDPYGMLKILLRHSKIGSHDQHYSINYTNPPYISFEAPSMFVDGITYNVQDINFIITYNKY